MADHTVTGGEAATEAATEAEMAFERFMVVEEWHGTLSGYKWHGCRCGKCRAYFAVKQGLARRRRTAQLTKGLVAVEHGKYSTYVNYGCRCTLCREANRLICQLQRERGRKGRSS